VASCVVGLGLLLFLTGFPIVTDYSKLEGFGIWPDVLHERATAGEALHGDPYRPISEIMPEYGYPEMTGGLSPRTPAALLFQIPLIAIPDTVLMPVVSILIAGLVVGILALSGRISALGWDKLALVGPLLFLSYPVVTGVSYGSVSVVITVVLVLLAWAFQDKDWAGIPLGLAAAMRLWPGLVIVGFWIAGRRRAAYVATAVFVVVNVVGLLLPGVTLEGSLHALTQGGGAWIDHNQNASLALILSRFDVPVVVSTLVASVIGVTLAIRNPRQAIAICAITALIASPLTWPAYILVALPILVSWWRAGGRLPVAILSAPLILWVGTPTGWKGPIGFAVLVVLLVYCGFVRSSRKSSGPSLTSHGARFRPSSHPVDVRRDRHLT